MNCTRLRLSVTHKITLSIMPELPEVETTCRGIAIHIVGRRIADVRVNNPNLRWPVPVDELTTRLPGRKILSVTRRAKYLLFDCGNGHLITHLGMSGSLRILEQATPADKHEHIEIFFSHGTVLRFRDPRRFGSVLWTDQAPDRHALLASLGPEPLDEDFNAEYLFKQTRRRRCCIKNLIMDSHIVTGIGNIYASEALFHAGIRPGKSAARLSRESCSRLVLAIQQVLTRAIDAGGTTLQDFTDSNGKAGYFSQCLYVYAREGENCLQCSNIIKRKVIGQRSSFYCPYCQK
jgi:formamidopyrimidine-DNA glycosylase